MKKILGLDIGVSSVGLAVIYENEKKFEIQDMAVRIIPEDPNFHAKFYTGNKASKNADRTINRGIRRGIQRFKQRRDRLYDALKANNCFPENELFELNALTLYGLRHRAVTEQISLMEFGRVLIHLNQRRGFQSNRKSNSEEEDSTDYKKRIAELEADLGNLTIGQKLYQELAQSAHPLSIVLRERTYLRASYMEEFDRIWDFQKKYYPEILTGGPQQDDNKGTLYELLRNKIIFFQRPLKSQKGLVSKCTFEPLHRCANRSSPYFEAFRIWQRINDLAWKNSRGETLYPDISQKKLIYEKLFHDKDLNAKCQLTVTKIKEIIGYSKNEKIYLNFPELDGSKTYRLIKNALSKANITNYERFLFFNPQINDEKGGLLELWHILYSIPTEQDLIKTLQKRFGFSSDQATIVANEVHFNSDYGSMSTKAIKKLLPYMEGGMGYSEACDSVGYDHSGYKTKIELQNKLQAVKPNSLRNPVVEQVLNQVVNVVNLAMEKHGQFDEIRVELARELRNSAKTRKAIANQNQKNKKYNESVRERLSKEYNFKLINGRDVKRYSLWEETNQICLYCNAPLTKTDFLNGQAEIEHILPKSRSFSNNMNNFILAHRKCNSTKGQLTAFDFMARDTAKLNDYIELVNSLYNDGKGKLSKAKFENLMCRGDQIPSDFVERMLKDTQYISKESVKLLKSVCEKTYTTTGQITDFLREKWNLKEVLKEVNLPKYEALGQVETKEIKDNNGSTKTITRIINWSKRDDHRHHAIDALICALTNQKIIFKLNNLNKIYQLEKDLLSKEDIENFERVLSEDFTEPVSFDLKAFAEATEHYFEEPMENMREVVKKQLDSIFISIKKNSKVLTKKINHGKFSNPQITWVPRGYLHEETIMGRVRKISENKIKITPQFNRVQDIVNLPIRTVILNHISQHGGDPKIAFSAKILKSNPILYKGNEVKEVRVFEESCTKRVKLNESLTAAQIEKIADSKIKELVKARLNQFDGKIKLAFADLEHNPLWLNKTQGICVKSITVFDESKVEKLREGFVKTGGNHHALIYKSDDGKYNDKVVSFWEAVEIGLLNIQNTGKPYPIIHQSDDPVLGNFQFSMQINDLFVFDFKHSLNPQAENELNFYDPANRALISQKLFRVQKMSKKSSGVFDVHFRHHLETSVLRDIPEVSWINLTSNKSFQRLTKIRLDAIGRIIQVS